MANPSVSAYDVLKQVASDHAKNLQAGLEGETARASAQATVNPDKVDDAYKNIIAGTGTTGLASLTSGEANALSARLGDHAEANRDIRTVPQMVGDVALAAHQRLAHLAGGLVQGLGDIGSATANDFIPKGMDGITGASKAVGQARDAVEGGLGSLHSDVYQKAEKDQTETRGIEDAAWQAQRNSIQQSNNAFTDALENVGHSAVNTVKDVFSPVTGLAHLAQTGVDLAGFENPYTAVGMGLSQGFDNARDATNHYSDEDLAQNSPAYKEAIAAGRSPEVARLAATANRETSEGADQALINTALNKVGLSKVMAPPLTSGLGSLGKDVFAATGDMAAASAASKLSSNLADQYNTNDKTKLLDGVADAAEEGAGSGLGLTALPHSGNVAGALAKASTMGGKAALTVAKNAAMLTGRDPSKLISKAMDLATKSMANDDKLSPEDKELGNKQVSDLSAAIKNKDLPDHITPTDKVAAIIKKSPDAVSAVSNLSKSITGDTFAGLGKLKDADDIASAKDALAHYQSMLKDSIPDNPVANKALQDTIKRINQTINNKRIDAAASTGETEIVPKHAGTTDNVAQAFKEAKGDPETALSSLTDIIKNHDTANEDSSRDALSASEAILNHPELRDKATDEQKNIAQSVLEANKPKPVPDDVVAKRKADLDTFGSSDSSFEEKQQALKEISKDVKKDPNYFSSLSDEDKEAWKNHYEAYTAELAKRQPVREQDNNSDTFDTLNKYRDAIKDSLDLRREIFSDNNGSLGDVHKQIVSNFEANNSGRLSFAGHISKVTDLLSEAKQAKGTPDAEAKLAAARIAYSNFSKFVEHMQGKADALNEGRDSYTQYLGRNANNEHVTRERNFAQEEHTDDFKNGINTEASIGQKAKNVLDGYIADNFSKTEATEPVTPTKTETPPEGGKPPEKPTSAPKTPEQLGFDFDNPLAHAASAEAKAAKGTPATKGEKPKALSKAKRIEQLKNFVNKSLSKVPDEHYVKEAKALKERLLNSKQPKAAKKAIAAHITKLIEAKKPVDQAPKTPQDKAPKEGSKPKETEPTEEKFVASDAEKEAMRKVVDRYNKAKDAQSLTDLHEKHMALPLPKEAKDTLTKAYNKALRQLNNPEHYSAENDFGRIAPDASLNKRLPPTETSLVSVDEKGSNSPFVKTFEPTGKTRIAGWSKPFKSIMTLMHKHADNFNEFLKAFTKKDSLSVNYNRDNVAAMHSYLSAFPEILAKANEAIKSYNSTGIKDGMFYKSANLNSLRLSENEGLHPVIGETAILALAQTLIDVGNRRSSHASVADTLAKLSAKSISKELYLAATQGVSKADAIDMFERHFNNFFGIRQKKTAPYFDAGMIKTLGNYMIKAADGEIGNIVETKYTKVSEDENAPEEVGYLSRYIIPDQLNPSNFLKRGENILMDMLSSSKERRVYVGEDKPNIPKTYMHSSVPLTETQRNAIKASNEIEYFPHKPTDNLIKALAMMTGSYSDDFLQKLIGGVPNENYNEQFNASEEGKKITLRTAMKAWVTYMDTLEGHAQAIGSDDHYTLPIRFGTELTGVNRTQLSGESPVSSKFLRMIFAPHKYEFSALKKDKGSFDTLNFKVGIAQLLGMKIQNIKSKAEFNTEFAELEKTHADALNALQRYHSDPDNFKAFDTDEQNALINSVDRSAEAFHALSEYARYKTALEDRKQKTFNTNMYVEQDGVTNGSSFAWRMFKADALNDQDLARGEALGFSGTGVDINHSTHPDLYTQEATKAASDISKDIVLKDVVENHNDKSLVKQTLTALSNFLGAFHPDITKVGDGQLEFKRAAIKPWGQIIVYGGGAKGLAKALIGDALTNMYKELSMTGEKSLPHAFAKLAEKSDIFDDVGHIASTLDMLLRNSLTRVRDRNTGEVYMANDEDTATFNSNIESNVQVNTPMKKFEVNPEFIESAANSFVKAYGSTIADSVDAAVGGQLKDNLNTLRQVAQIHGNIISSLYRSALINSVKKRLPDATDREVLRNITPEDVAVAQKAAQEAGSAIPVDDKYNLSFMNSAPRSFGIGDDNLAAPITIGNNINKGLDIRIPTASPTENGAIATSVLASGDGAAMNEFLTNAPPEIRKQVTAIFDGINASPDNSSAVSQAINKAMETVSKYNPMLKIAKTLIDKRDHVLKTLDSLPEEVSNYLIRSNPLWDVKGEGSEALKNHYISQLDRLLAVGQRVQAHIETRAELPITNSDFATLHFDKEGNLDNGYHTSNPEKQGDYQDFESFKNAYNEKLLDKFSGIAKEEKGYGSDHHSDKEEQPLLQGNERNLTLNTGQGRDWAVLRDRVNSLPDPYGNKDLVKSLINSPMIKGKDLTIHIDDEEGKNSTYQGNEIHIHSSKDVMETLAHELIHAATEHALTMKNGKFVNQDMKAIQALKNRVLDLAKKEDIDTKTSLSDLAGIVNRHKGDEAAQTAEFLAWGISNPEMSAELDKYSTTVGDNGLLNKIKRFTTSALNRFKRLLGVGELPKDNPSVLDALLAHTSRIQETEANPVGNTLREQRVYGDNEYTELNSALSDVLSPMRKAQLEQNIKNLETLSDLKDVMASGINLNAQQQHTFRNLAGVFHTTSALDGVYSAKIHQLYDTIADKVATSDILPDKTKELLFSGKQNIASKMAITSALAVVHPELKDFVSKIEPPKGVSKDSWDAALGSLGNSAIRKLSDVITKTSSKDSIPSQMEDLLGNVQEATDKQSKFFQRTSQGNFLDTATKAVNDAIDSQAAKMRESSNHKVHLLGEILSDTTSGEVADRVLGWFNKQPSFFARELANDIFGSTKGNTDVYAHLKRIRGEAQNLRQDVIEKTPELLNSQFDKEMGEDDWNHVNNTHGKADLASFASFSEMKKAVESPKALDSTVSSLEKNIRSVAGKNADTIMAKSQQLAEYLHSGKVGKNLLTNSDAIMHLLGEREFSTPVKSEALSQDIDKLVSLYTLKKADGKSLDTFRTLLDKEPKGMEFTHNLMRNIKENSLLKTNSAAKFSHIKGFFPDKRTNEEHILLLRDADAQKYVNMGYQRIENYQGSSIEPKKEARGYYYLPVDGDSLYQQGGVQNIQETCGGMSTKTGYAHSLSNGGTINNKDVVNHIFDNRFKERNEAESLRPIYDKNGVIKGYERSLSKEVMSRLPYDNNMSRKIGRAMGRHIEESVAHHLNDGLMKTLYDAYDPKRQSEYVNLLDPKLMDAPTKKIVSMLGDDIKGMAEDYFGEKTFYVRKEQLNDVIGMNRASVGDFWTGNSRWSDETQQHFSSVLNKVFGNDAYVKLKRIEKGLQGTASSAKNSIVIRSVVVPWNNLKGNFAQLLLSGVSPRQMAVSFPRKLAEIEAYSKANDNKTKYLIAKAGTQDKRLQAAYQTRIDAIDETTKKLSIYPLIKANELSSVASDRYQAPDKLLREGKLHKYMETLVDQLPEGMQQLGKFAIVGKDTALYAGLEKAVEYGDFLSKAVLHDHNINRLGMTEAESINRIRDAFVDYDRLSGRNRDYIESLGLGWFMNFKLRSCKEAYNLIRHQPLRSLLSTGINHSNVFGQVGTPLNDNIFVQGIDGRITNSLGIGELFRGVTLNPYYNLLF